tara:strand:- start:396 stop:671 length:276 start_codon:yes stop_codon:yes gene_type:complete
MTVTISPEFKAELQQMYFDSQVFGASADIAARGGDTPADCIQRAFDYIEDSISTAVAWGRTCEMFQEWEESVDVVVEDLGGFTNCLIEGVN